MKHGFLLMLIFSLVSCSSVRYDMIRAELVRAEDTRNVEALRDTAHRLRDDETLLADRTAIAAGRIGDFYTWQYLADRFGEKPPVADALDIAARFPSNGFPAETVRDTLLSFAPTRENTITLLHLKDGPAFEAAISREAFADDVAANLWRAPELATPELVTEWYVNRPGPTLYSVARLRLTGIVMADDLENVPVDMKVYGVGICDDPSRFRQDPDWRVRIAALRADPTRFNAQDMLADENPLVVAEALAIFGKEDGGLWRLQLDDLSPMQAEWLFRNRPGEAQTLDLFEKGGMMAHAVAPYLPDGELDRLLASGVNPVRILMYVERTRGEEAAIQFARERFAEQKDPASLQYLLGKTEETEKTALVDTARDVGGELLSILDDFGHLETTIPERTLARTLADLEEADALTGFTLVTASGNIHGEFLPDGAPLTCLNFARLAAKGYFDGTPIHRVAPAFVTQDGDPSGTGSGGPGYAIRCEYNRYRYQGAGVIGMALAGKDTGGSQYFLTHLATPHLDQNYTVFAVAPDSLATLAVLQQYDEITQVKLDEPAHSETGH